MAPLEVHECRISLHGLATRATKPTEPDEPRGEKRQRRRLRNTRIRELVRCLRNRGLTTATSWTTVRNYVLFNEQRSCRSDINFLVKVWRRVGDREIVANTRAETGCTIRFAKARRAWSSKCPVERDREIR
jgi:hypothetical protein